MTFCPTGCLHSETCSKSGFVNIINVTCEWCNTFFKHILNLPFNINIMWCNTFFKHILNLAFNINIMWCSTFLKHILNLPS